MSVEFDDSRYPLVVVTFEGVTSDAQFDDYLAKMTRNIERRQTTAVVLDAARAGAPSALQRRQQADWLKRYELLLRKHSAGTAFVITAPLIRGALTAILWIQPMPAPHTVVATRSEAERWATQQLAKWKPRAS